MEKYKKSVVFSEQLPMVSAEEQTDYWIWITGAYREFWMHEIRMPIF